MTKKVDQAELLRLYRDPEIPAPEVCERLGISQRTMQRRLKEIGEPFRGGLADLPIAEICQLYEAEREEDRWTISQIAEKYGVNAATVSKHLKRAGVTLRDRGDYSVSRVPDDEVRRLYVEEELSLEQVGERLGFTGVTIRDRLIALGIPRRPPRPTAEIKTGRPARKVELPIEEIRRLRDEEKLSLRQIAKQLGVPRTTVQRQLAQADGTYVRSRKSS